jgi:hypothetical protein
MSGVDNQLTHNVSNITMYVSSPELRTTGIPNQIGSLLNDKYTVKKGLQQVHGGEKLVLLCG